MSTQGSLLLEKEGVTISFTVIEASLHISRSLLTQASPPSCEKKAGYREPLHASFSLETNPMPILVSESTWLNSPVVLYFWRDFHDGFSSVTDCLQRFDNGIGESVCSFLSDHEETEQIVFRTISEDENGLFVEMEVTSLDCFFYKEYADDERPRLKMTIATRLVVENESA